MVSIIYLISWEELAKELHITFNEHAYKNLMAELEELQRSGTPQEHMKSLSIYGIVIATRIK